MKVWEASRTLLNDQIIYSNDQFIHSNYFAIIRSFYIIVHLKYRISFLLIVFATILHLSLCTDSFCILIPIYI